MSVTTELRQHERAKQLQPATDPVRAAEEHAKLAAGHPADVRVQAPHVTTSVHADQINTEARRPSAPDRASLDAIQRQRDAQQAPVDDKTLKVADLLEQERLKARGLRA